MSDAIDVPRFSSVATAELPQEWLNLRTSTAKSLMGTEVKSEVHPGGLDLIKGVGGVHACSRPCYAD